VRTTALTLAILLSASALRAQDTVTEELEDKPVVPPVSETEPLDDPAHAGDLSERPPDGRPSDFSEEQAKADLLHEALSTGRLDEALLYAVELDNPTAVREIVARGADVNRVVDATTGTTALHAAVSANHPAVVGVLLEEGADPRMRAATDAFFSPDIVEAHRLLARADGWTPEDVTRGNLDIWQDWRAQGHSVFSAEDLDAMIARAEEILLAFRAGGTPDSSEAE
jgi:hypothetical protein